MTVALSVIETGGLLRCQVTCRRVNHAATSFNKTAPRIAFKRNNGKHLKRWENLADTLRGSLRRRSIFFPVGNLAARQNQNKRRYTMCVK